MDIAVIGINHKTASINIREKVVFSERDMKSAYERLNRIECIKESFILSTCNRTEIYGYVPQGIQGTKFLQDFIMKYHGIDDSIMHYFYQYHNRDAVEHIHKVASGLDSMVIGEDQILGQVKQALEKAREEGAAGPVLNTLLRHAITCAKKIKTQTGLSRYPLSVSSIAVKAVKNQFGNICGKKFFILGLGEISIITIKNLINEGVKDIYISNRNQRKADLIKQQAPQIHIVRQEERSMVLTECDVVISSTSAPHYVLKRDDLIEHYQGYKPLFLIDLSLPRDIEPSIGDMQNVTLICLDDLEQVSQGNREKRNKEIVSAEELVKSEVDSFREWYLQRLFHKETWRDKHVENYYGWNQRKQVSLDSNPNNY